MAVLTTALTSVLMFLAVEGLDPPWPARRPPVRPAGGHELTTLSFWPPEPTAPATVDPARFRASFAHLCGQSEDDVPADELLAGAKGAGVDPFLLAALVRERSHCLGRRKIRQGFGLLALQPSMYDRPGAPAPLEEDDMRPSALLRADHNLRIGAKLLRMWMDIHPMLDEEFGGVPHRSGVAHFLWGDEVMNSGGEDAVYTARRRILNHYLGAIDVPTDTPLGLPVFSPLEGTPRISSSGPGEDRDGGARLHKGLDIVASDGEPVRSIADGTVIFAGVNMRGSPRRRVPPSQIARFRNKRLGAGGIYVCIHHDLNELSDDSQMVSCYMHLQGYQVRGGQHVSAGQVIGQVGHTGVYNSPTHLHFEVRVDDQARNPINFLSGLVIPPQATKTYYHVMANKKARQRAARAAALHTTSGI